jgi:hypothetical protein
MKKVLIVMGLIFSISLFSSDNSSADWQIKTYSSAAPSFIGDFATVIGGKGDILRKGSNGWTCQHGNPRPFPETGWKSAHEAMPVCHDDEGMKWMMALGEGTKPNLSRDSFMWMLHGDVGEDNLVPGVLDKKDTTPGQWIESGPHLMLMPKDPKTLENFTSDFSKGEPYVMFPGTDYAHLMIPVEGYYQYQK